jgi:putative glycerol-1-phosphate prenyltransferase
MKIYNYLLNTISTKGAAYLILIDPDKISHDKLPVFVKHCQKSGVDAFLLGGSLMMNDHFEDFILTVKKNCTIPTIIFPGGVNQVSPNADAILYLSVVSGRNPEHLIGKHVLAAPFVKQAGIEPISTGYILIESGLVTTVQYVSGSQPIPRNKPEIAAATALAAEYLGMRLIYLEAGSGAHQTVPNEMVQAVSNYCSVPLVVGGGIRNAAEAGEKVRCGAKIIVTGNYFEDENNWDQIKEFAEAVHVKLPVTV